MALLRPTHFAKLCIIMQARGPGPLVTGAGGHIDAHANSSSVDIPLCNLRARTRSKHIPCSPPSQARHNRMALSRTRALRPLALAMAAIGMVLLNYSLPVAGQPPVTSETLQAEVGFNEGTLTINIDREVFASPDSEILSAAPQLVTGIKLDERPDKPEELERGVTLTVGNPGELMKFVMMPEELAKKGNKPIDFSSADNKEHSEILIKALLTCTGSNCGDVKTAELVGKVVARTKGDPSYKFNGCVKETGNLTEETRIRSSKVDRGRTKLDLIMNTTSGNQIKKELSDGNKKLVSEISRMQTTFNKGGVLE